MSALIEPNPTRSSPRKRSRENLRIVMDGPLSDNGGMMTLTREPSPRRASTSGLPSSIRRPTGVTIRSITFIRAASLEKRCSERSIRPLRSTKIWWGPLTMTSLTDSSSINGSIGPRPMASATTAFNSASRSISAGTRISPWSINISAAERASPRISSADI